MKCPECQSENPEEAKFCGKCDENLFLMCPQCGSENTPGNNFCNEWVHNLTIPSEAACKDLSFGEKTDKIQRYLPKGLTDKILGQRGKIECIDAENVKTAWIDLGKSPVFELWKESERVIDVRGDHN
jgi:hypothetical protein